MSIHAMNLVWRHFRRGGSEKLALLALADWCDDEGCNLHPSITTVARKICVSESQARRIMHGFQDEGLLQVVGNHNGGAKGQSRRYRLNLAKLASTPSIYATPSMGATPSTDARYPLHGCALPLAPMTPNTSLTIKEPSMGFSTDKEIGKPENKKQRLKGQVETLQTFIERCKADGSNAVPADDPIFDYASDVGLSDDVLALCWFVFKARHLSPDKKQKDWRAHYRNAVKGNWFKLWYFASDGEVSLTTAGRQARREMDAQEKRESTT